MGNFYGYFLRSFKIGFGFFFFFPSIFIFFAFALQSAILLFDPDRLLLPLAHALIFERFLDDGISKFGDMDKGFLAVSEKAGKNIHERPYWIVGQRLERLHCRIVKLKDVLGFVLKLKRQIVRS